MAENTDAFERAEKQIPENFLEKHIFWTVRGATLLAMLAGILVNEFPKCYDAGMIASMSVYILGRIADRHSTIKLLKTVEQAKKIYIHQPYVEKGEIIEGVSTIDEYTKHPKKYIDYAMTFFAAMPIFGVGIGVGAITAALNNYKKARRVERAIDIGTAG